MNYTGYEFAGHKLASLSIGCMRFPRREAAEEIIAACVSHGVLYLDTAPMYCYKSEEENSETWAGAAIAGMRDKVIVSAKCATGGGGAEVGEYNPSRGFSITTADQVRKEIDQSLRRLNVDKLDCYHLWAVHAPKLFDEALKPGGWMEGVQKAREEGLFTHLGITGHCDSAEIKRWVDSGFFEMITVPFHLLDRTRLDGVRYALSKGLAVIAMNPLAGGLLGSASAVLEEELADLNVTSAADMALRYVMSFPGVSALCGMTSADQVPDNVASAKKPLWTTEEAQRVELCVEDILSRADHLCTSCGYCMPCPKGLNIPEVLKLRNYYRLFQLESAKVAFEERHKWWGDAFKVDECIACGKCESHCPNGLPVGELMKDVMCTLGKDILSAASEK